MANQIAANLQHGAGSEADAADQVANHMRRFWARSMKIQLSEYLREDGGELSPLAREAVARLDR
ncbi:formate dehydrogenase subunit delta [Kineobactrum salinum]|uniref:Formate dehydrogenase subunit delta n=2 Tax=Kineobactrum salinum TaxID=2708301 RepID=A0A6C0U6J9_9GAMM|nr:formate dehydrogenase subunit delta [Kineobactrum salinum]